MKQPVFVTLALVSVWLLPMALTHGITPSPARPAHVLRAWQIADRKSNEYLWSVEGPDNESPTGTLYESLKSPSLLDKVGRLPQGTKLKLNWGRGGVLDESLDADFEFFRKFCASKGIDFEFTINTN